MLAAARWCGQGLTQGRCRVISRAKHLRPTPTYPITVTRRFLEPGITKRQGGVIRCIGHTIFRGYSNTSHSLGSTENEFEGVSISDRSKENSAPLEKPMEEQLLLPFLDSFLSKLQIHASNQFVTSIITKIFKFVDSQASTKERLYSDLEKMMKARGLPFFFPPLQRFLEGGDAMELLNTIPEVRASRLVFTPLVQKIEDGGLPTEQEARRDFNGQVALLICVRHLFSGGPRLDSVTNKQQEYELLKQKLKKQLLSTGLAEGLECSRVLMDINPYSGGDSELCSTEVWEDDAAKAEELAILFGNSLEDNFHRLLYERLQRFVDKRSFSAQNNDLLVESLMKLLKGSMMRNTLIGALTEFASRSLIPSTDFSLERDRLMLARKEKQMEAFTHVLVGARSRISEGLEEAATPLLKRAAKGITKDPELEVLINRIATILDERQYYAFYMRLVKYKMAGDFSAASRHQLFRNLEELSGHAEKLIMPLLAKHLDSIAIDALQESRARALNVRSILLDAVPMQSLDVAKSLERKKLQERESGMNDGSGSGTDIDRELTTTAPKDLDRTLEGAEDALEMMMAMHPVWQKKRKSKDGWVHLDTDLSGDLLRFIPPTHKIYVGNLPRHIDEAQLELAFSRIGQVDHVEIFRDREILEEEKDTTRKDGRKARTNVKRKPRADFTGVYGFVYFKSAKDLERALAPSVRLFGMRIRAHYTKVEGEDGPARDIVESAMCNIDLVSDRRTLRIADIAYGTQVEELVNKLEELFEPFIKVNLKESLGRGSLLRRGKAFIDFSTHDLADLAYRCLAGRLSFNGEPAKVGFAAKRRTGGGRMQNTQQGRQAPSRERGEDWSDDH